MNSFEWKGNQVPVHLRERQQHQLEWSHMTISVITREVVLITVVPEQTCQPFNVKQGITSHSQLWQWNLSLVASPIPGLKWMNYLTRESGGWSCVFNFDSLNETL